MSCNEWEGGTITLPSAETKKVRDAVRAAAEKHGTRLYDEAQRFWKLLSARNKANFEGYHAWSECFVYGNGGGSRYQGVPAMNPVAEELRDDLSMLLGTCGPHMGSKARRLQQRDVVTHIGKATGTKPSFRCGEASISFDGRKVNWYVPENNHARDGARDHPIARALFLAFRGVRWTRGSGGQIVGNDEYNGDGGGLGAGGNYLVEEFGPKAHKAYRW